MFSSRPILVKLQRGMIRTASSYGIETASGIYLLKKKSESSFPTSNASLFENTNNGYLTLFLPITKKPAPLQLMDVHDLSKQFKTTNNTVLSGFSLSDKQFTAKACFVVSNTQDVIQHNTCFIDDNFSKLVFQFSNNAFKLVKYLRNISCSNIPPLNLYEDYCIERFQDSCCCPSLSEENFAPVFSNYEKSYDVLHQDTIGPVIKCLPQCLSHPGSFLLNMSHRDLLQLSRVNYKVREFVTHAHQIISTNQFLMNKPRDIKHPFIVVEGLDGTGKTTMVRNLSNHFGAVTMGTPPISIKPHRQVFDELPELCRRSYYAFSNYLAACDVMNVAREKPVVMDRYWHSSTAYAIAKECYYGTEQYLPPLGHHIYKWPVDLLKPSAVVFLTTPEIDRDERVNEREDVTREEKIISKSKKLRARIIEVYRRIGFPTWIEVDTSGTQEQSLTKAVQGLIKADVITP